VEPLYVIGAGGIGCAVGYVLCAAGVRVTFVDANPAKVLWGRSHGVRLDRRPPQSAEFQLFADWVPSAGATVLLCTKCYDNAAVLARLSAQAVTLIPIQNGFDPALDARGHTLAGIASFVSECEPGRAHTRITRGGRLHLGFRGAWGTTRAAGSVEERLSSLADLLRRQAPFRVDVVPDVLPYKYTKLMYNAAISPLAAAAGLDNGQLLSVPKARRLFFDLLHENYAVLRAAGIRLGKIGPFHPSTVERILRLRAVANALAWALYPTLRRSYCSMSGDLPRGRTEIDFYNRHLIDLAGDGPCPLNRRVYALVKRMEQERLPPRVDILDELAA
jgi:2-dehydropantoate 2-reductase